MKKLFNSKTFTIAVCLVLSLALLALTACSQTASKGKYPAKKSAGVLILRVNPEIAIEYDAEGMVTSLTAKNKDAKAILEGKEDLIGKETRAAVAQLVKAIGEAGYFVEEIEGQARTITIEIEKGSTLPHGEFISEVVAEVRKSIKNNDWKVPIGVENESDYGLSDYDDNDYTDYDDDDSDYDDDDTDYDDDSDYGNTDYDDDDTNYDDTDYDDNDTDYDDDDTNYDDDDDDDTDYDSVTDFDNDDSDYDNVTDFDNDDSDYDDDDNDND